MPFPHASRRSFLRHLALGAAAAPFVTRGLFAQSPNGKVRHASFGLSGMAWSDLTSLASHPGIEMVAGCDVDEGRAAQFRQKFPQARVYADYRELLEKEKDLQSVNVSTPDHMHAPIGMAAMQRGLHVYGQKPLTHDVYESRRLAEFAREKKLVTQMGIQIHSSSEYRTAVRLIQSGAIGKVREVHTWSSKRWGDTGAMPAGGDEIPKNLGWDLWLGVCAERPFIGKGWYHPGNWRRRLDFGTGTFGDMGCHIYDPVFKALALTSPLSLRSEGAAPNAHSWANDARIHYVFPGTPFSEGKTVSVYWYDGTARPPEEIVKAAGGKLPDQGSVFLGTEGEMVLPHIGAPSLLGKAAGKPVEKAAGSNHWHEFVDAVMGKGPKPGANFDYAGPLTEAVLLGGIATRFPRETLEWKTADLAFAKRPEATTLVRRAYRKGFEVKGL